MRFGQFCQRFLEPELRDVLAKVLRGGGYSI